MLQAIVWRYNAEGCLFFCFCFCGVAIQGTVRFMNYSIFVVVAITRTRPVRVC